MNDNAAIGEYEQLREQRAQAQSMLDSGELQGLAPWAGSYEQQVRCAMGVLAERESSSAALLARLSKTLADFDPIS